MCNDKKTTAARSTKRTDEESPDKGSCPTCHVSPDAINQLKNQENKVE